MSFNLKATKKEENKKSFFLKENVLQEVKRQKMSLR